MRTGWRLKESPSATCQISIRTSTSRRTSRTYQFILHESKVRRGVLVVQGVLSLTVWNCHPSPGQPAGRDPRWPAPCRSGSKFNRPSRRCRGSASTRHYPADALCRLKPILKRSNSHDYWRYARPRRPCHPAAVRIHEGLHRATTQWRLVRVHQARPLRLPAEEEDGQPGWVEVDPELTEHYGAECRELHIMLIDDDIENVFPSSYAWWRQPTTAPRE